MENLNFYVPKVCTSKLGLLNAPKVRKMAIWDFLKTSIAHYYKENIIITITLKTILQMVMIEQPSYSQFFKYL